MPSRTRLTKRFEDALMYAARVHARQRRKGTAIPYVSHLLGATAIVLENGGGEDEAIAALLHDAAEDQGGRPRLADIRKRFGPRVARIVAGCTDAYTIPKPPWGDRKRAYLEHLRDAPPAVRLVSAADKLHNARTILADVRQDGDIVWDRFTSGKTGTLWYYGALRDVFRELGPAPMANELDRVVAELERLAAPRESARRRTRAAPTTSARPAKGGPRTRR